MDIYISRDGETFGPFTTEMCITALVEGHLQNSDLAWYEGLTQWHPLHTLIGKKVLKTVSAVSQQPVVQVFEYSDPRDTSRVAPSPKVP